ncbi:hypothetical protein Hanom_Chr04g00369471 [Helianthus anomalus]
MLNKNDCACVYVCISGELRSLVSCCNFEKTGVKHDSSMQAFVRISLSQSSSNGTGAWKTDK